MDRRTKVCIWVIMVGLGNFLAYVIVYWFLWGEAVNGHVEQHGGELRYFLQSGEEVSRAAFIYSGIHSISIAATVGAIMLAMLTLAKDRVISSMRRTIVRGRTMITILATIITLIVVVWTIWFVLQFARRLVRPRDPAAGVPSTRGVAVREGGGLGSGACFAEASRPFAPRALATRPWFPVPGSEFPVAHSRFPVPGAAPWLRTRR